MHLLYIFCKVDTGYVVTKDCFVESHYRRGGVLQIRTRDITLSEGRSSWGKSERVLMLVCINVLA